MKLTLEHVPSTRRLGLLQDEIASALNIDFTPLADPIRLDAEISLFPGVSMMFGHNSPSIIRRRDLSRTSDDFELVWSRVPSRGLIRHVGRECDRLGGDAVLASACDDYESRMDSDFAPVILRIERRLLLPLLPQAEDKLMRPIPTYATPFVLLRSYIEALRSIRRGGLSGLAGTIARHIADLVALTAGATGDGAVEADRRGGRAARFAAIKSWISQRCIQQEVSIGEVASAMGASVRYVQTLFEGEGTTFSHFVLDQRLEYAAQILTSPHANQRVTDIAYDSGFSDLSYFNRAFRARFGCTPSDMRQRARSEPGRTTAHSMRLSP